MHACLVNIIAEVFHGRVVVFSDIMILMGKKRRQSAVLAIVKFCETQVLKKEKQRDREKHNDCLNLRVEFVKKVKDVYNNQIKGWKS